ncbi:nucleoside-triphosphatase [uncultured Psychroserpens sp.]|uniref:nucleoside-triphosphatase n=1 Tax=uncultured Psychroserpens sp. TaxID=255436 RepID=UPI002621BBFF|nr:nucleoside-triphosphatase [uncultured Psychroserpens sp.]
MIYIVTGDIRSGKTSALLDWISNKENVDGVLCPDDVSGKRYFLKVKSKEIFPLEVESGIENKDIVEVGPFKFLNSAFDKANEFLKSLTSEMNNTFLIIDELGKLELKGLGLHSAAEVLIPKYMSSNKQHAILVVRTSLLQSIIEHYDIKYYKLINKDNLLENSFA